MTLKQDKIYLELKVVQQITSVEAFVEIVELDKYETFSKDAGLITDLNLNRFQSLVDGFEKIL